MSKLSNRICYVFFLALMLSSEMKAQSTKDESQFTLPPVLYPKLAAQAKLAQPARTLLGFTAVQTVDHKTNFNKGDTDAVFTLERLDNGLFGAQSSWAMRDGRGKGWSSGLNLCGLVQLLNESRSALDNSVTIGLPAGKNFVPFGIKSSADFSTRFRVINFETIYPTICAPVAGAEFSYKVETELTVKSPGMFGRTANVKRTVDVKCLVGSEVLPAAALGASILEEYLQVSCAYLQGDGKASKSKFAYLTASRYYLPVEEVSEWQTTGSAYSAVTYSKTE